LRLAVIGAGPAGTEAALALARLGVPVDVFDEQFRPGGNVGRTRVDASASALETRASGGDGVRISMTARVLTVCDRTVEFWRNGQLKRRQYDAVLLCCGTYDMHLPLRGTPAPRVSTAGALQALLKGQGIVPDGDIVIAGSGPFLYAAAAGLARAGAHVVAIVDRLRTSDYARLTAYAASIPGNGADYLRFRLTLARCGVAIYRGESPVAVEGGRLMLASGTCLRFDHLGTTDLFIPQTQLARTAGCRQRYSSRGGYYVTDTDAFGRSSMPGVYVCGEGRGIRGWRHARLSGRLTALTAAADFGVRPTVRARVLRRRIALVCAFAEALERRMRRRQPTDWPDKAIVCACEAVPAAAVREAAALGLEDLSSIKVVTRCGMGPCQGRYCEPLLCRLLEATGHAPRSPLRQRTLTRPVAAKEYADEA
jgi:NADPH-dependent 2,4-dienoyl-CoA reductase/sulfur reductase-like enzyme